MDIGASASGKALKEIFNKLRLQIADQARLHFCVDHRCDAAAQVDGRDAERFIHRHQKISGSHDALLIAEGAVEGLAERNAYVLDCVVLVHVQITVACEIEIESPVARKQFQHVIEKANA